DAVFAHLAGCMRDDLVILLLELDAERRIGQQLGDCAGELERLFFGHARPALWLGWPENGSGGGEDQAPQSGDGGVIVEEAALSVALIICRARSIERLI